MDTSRNSNEPSCLTCTHRSLPVHEGACKSCEAPAFTNWMAGSAPISIRLIETPAAPPKQTLGVKFDQLKARWSLVPRKVMAQVVEVLTFGAAKYSSDNWMHVDPEKYYNALHRHVDAWRNGEKYDEESGKHHLAHALCCLLFMLWHDDNPKEKDPA